MNIYRTFATTAVARRLFCFAAGLSCAVLAQPADAQTMRTIWTTFMRAGPGLQYTVIDEVDEQRDVDVQGCGNGWCRVVFGDRDGYIRQDHLSANPPAPAPEASAKAPCFDARRSGYGNGDEQRYCGR